ncbi:MAG: hypothetical protein K8H84_00315 [Sulfuricella denitrificans]|nr:hypothetical protein [Sulfuricella denitrificans]
MFRQLIGLFFTMIAFASGSNAASSSGTLIQNIGYDWRYLWTKTDSVKRIQSQFIWQKTPVGTEHGIVAYTIGGQNGYLNSTKTDPLWSYGVGAYVMQSKGLALEVWGPAQFAYTWDQNGAGSIGYPSNGTILPVITLDQAKSGLFSYYISSNSGFALKDGFQAAYWVRLTLTRLSGGWLDVRADLYENSTLVQMARMQVVENSWLPAFLNGVPQAPRGTVACGNCSAGNTLYYTAFDSF